ncbi:MAG: type II toxin-antitoxin system RelB/DinJ family antitoxin [Epsilonproteobacteria bacterium]|nr:type II toxin-antitoxin system RelB/DinJ family antitoxin [Campylobacterota bacterium]
MKVQTSLRLEKRKFLEAKEILAQLGLNFSEAVNIFTSMIVQTKGLPFEIKIPNDETKKAIQEARTGTNSEIITLEEPKNIRN